MKHILILSLTLFFFFNNTVVFLQSQQQNRFKQKAEKIQSGNADSSVIRNPTLKVRPAPALQTRKQQPPKETPNNDADFLGPLSWRPGLLF